MPGHYWVVTCKNTEYHAQRNPFFQGHRIPMGKTDPYSPRPTIPDSIEITCDDAQCGKTYSYSASEIWVVG
jgi:hypothetical protein